MSTANSVNSGLDCASPESIMDPTNLTAIGDQYSLGCVLYFCLSGRYPFPDGTAVEKMMAHQHKQPTPLKELAPETPDELIAVVEKLMQKKPTDRYVNCQEAIEALRPFAAASPAVRRPSAQMPPRPPLPKPAAPLPAATPRPARPAPLLRPANGAVPAPAPADTPPVAIPVNPPAAIPVNPAPPIPVAKVASVKPPPPAPPKHREETIVETAPTTSDRPPFLQRLGPVGIALLAIMAGAIAWLVSSFIKF
jgi:serine/threonine-protein kinase